MISILIKESYPLTGKPYPKRLIFKVVGYSSSTWYENPTLKTGKRGRKPKHSDAEVLHEIKKEIKNSMFNSEGYITVKKRIAKREINALLAGKARVNRIMRENNLLSPNRRPKKTNKREHDGTIITDSPNLMWATDGKKFWIEGLGWHWFFGVIDHFNDEIISWHIAKKGNRFAAMEPVRSAVRKRFDSVDKDVCKRMKLQLRSDHGSQYDSADFMNEMKYLGLEMSKAFVRSPQCNGIIERFHRTLEEQVFQTEIFSSFKEAYDSINQFIKDYNRNWILHRLDYCSPVEYREKYAESRRKEKDDIPSGNKEPEVQFVLISSGSMPRRNESVEKERIKGETTHSNNPSEILRYNLSPSDQLVRYKSNK
ncbi:MAG: integrase core domain-containing protein [Dysgonamonadaceae bacterium]|nr:integrase core domain-containing protein [Dysgonamonadaceae bacterium]